jgi:Protein of unknown function (DUF2786)
VENAEKPAVDPVEREKIKARLMKLNAMAADKSSPEEAATAASMARKLMDKYQLEEWELTGKIKEEFGTMNATPYMEAHPQYMSTLAVAIAQYNYCQAIYVYGEHNAHAHKRGQAVQFQGYKDDCELAVEMYKKLLSAINRLCKEFMAVQPGAHKTDLKISANFKKGAASAIIATVRAITREQRLLEAETASTSLVLAKEKAVNERFGEVRYVTQKARKQSDAERHAYTKGVVEGSKVEVVKRVG